ncbi:response regulator [Roseiflexus sp.]|jgi:CheY-like chemotaxis protein|uniref:response regulator n=1 Tax=Roseiflexus TaxID=120961 RepID=UPI000CB3587B|nr:response regulator [Roseiflexus sp.]PMP84232.1 MAG: two-component system response regulator [Roseiflexus castenholzii]GIW01713.1 MAG: response regulator [Roseiflexus sp.]
MTDTTLRVLLVEDNDDHAELIRRTLSEQQRTPQIVHVSDGESALDYLHRRGAWIDPAQSPRPHVILLDLRLPRVDGLDVLMNIKQSADLRRIPVVVLTTSSAERDVTRAYDAHANSYLVKPFGFEDFRNLMHDVGVYWLMRNTVAHL